MKRLLIAGSAALFVFGTYSCKKGPNDPALSFSSRKARLANEWIVASYYEYWKDTDGNDSDEQTTEYDGTNVTSTWTSVSSGVTTSGTDATVVTVNTFEYIINKDGTWEMTMDVTSVDTDEPWAGTTIVSTTSEVSTASGTWAWIGKESSDDENQDYKKKERVLMNTLASTNVSQTTTVTTVGGVSTTNTGDTYTSNYTYESGENSDIWDIDKLKGKEMTWKMTGSGTDSWSQASPGGTTTTYSGTSTSEVTVEFTQK